MPTSRQNPELPLIQLRLAAPFIEELERRNIDASGVLAEFSLDRKAFDDENHYVPAATMYRLAEGLGECSGDPHFGVFVGESLDLSNWPPMVEAVRRSGTVGEFLLRFMEAAGQQENSVTQELKTVGQKTTFVERRFADEGITPSHNDGFTIAYLLNILRSALGEAWDGSQVLVRVCDPDAIPNRYLGIRTALGDTLGARIRFPTYWLLLKLSPLPESEDNGLRTATHFPVQNIVDAFRFAVRPHIHDMRLDADRAAEICGMNKRTLARKLQYKGTSISGEIHAMRRERAELELLETDKSVSVIALDIGYNNPVVFSRAFKRWTGLTPSEFRTRALYR